MCSFRVYRKDDISNFPPEMRSPVIMKHGDDARNFIISKIINGHLAALRAPHLSQMLTWMSRQYQLQAIIDARKKQ